MRGVFGSLHPFYEGGGINGRKMANAGFMDALFTLDPFDAYHFYVGNTGALEHFWKERAHLPALRRGAVYALPRTELAARLATEPYAVFHFSDPIDDFVKLAQARNRYAPRIFPVTCVTHSINYQSYAAAFLAHLWEGCAPCDALGPNSPAAAEVILRYFACLRAGYGLRDTVPAPLVRVQPMGVPVDALLDTASPVYARQRADMRARLGAGEGACVFLLFGRISLGDKMDIHPLLMALREAVMQGKNLDMQLVISGFSEQNDNACDYLASLARFLRLPVHLLPNPTDADKTALFAAADVFVSPSDNIQETFGLSLLEAGAAALPAIAADWDGYRSVIEHGRTGLLVPTLAPAATPELDSQGICLFDNQSQYLRSQRTVVSVPLLTRALLRLASGTEERRRMGTAAQAQVAAHGTWEAVVRRWCAFWEELQQIEIDGDTERRLRNARHPLHLPAGEIFASYATAALAGDAPFHLTELGDALRKKVYPVEIAGKLPVFVAEDMLRHLLTLSRQGGTLDALCARWAYNREASEAVVLWALKHGLLALTPA